MTLIGPLLLQLQKACVAIASVNNQMLCDLVNKLEAGAEPSRSQSSVTRSVGTSSTFSLDRNAQAWFAISVNSVRKRTLDNACCASCNSNSRCDNHAIKLNILKWAPRVVKQNCWQCLLGATNHELFKFGVHIPPTIVEIC